MNNLIFIAVCLCWVFVASQVAYWATIAAIGFKLETPLFFIKYDHICFITSWLLFPLAMVLAFFQTLLPAWIALLSLLVARSLVKALSRKRGCMKYREIVTDIFEDAKKNGEDTSSYEKSLQKTDKEILEEARMRVRLGIT